VSVAVLLSSPLDRPLPVPDSHPVYLLRHEVHSFLDKLANELCGAGYSKQDIFCIRLALEEAICNAIHHGHAQDPDKPVQVVYYINRQRILARVQDEGPGFDPAQVADPRLEENLDRPGGRGLLLMRSYMDRVEFNARGNGVTLTKFRSSLSLQRND
jgi:serine/threonine-protein kinase RsbW